MAKQATVTTTDVDPLDRLEEKINLLVQMVTQLRGEQAQAAEEHARLVQDNDSLREQLGSAESAQQELDALLGERVTIRGRVSDMLSQLESI
jgi:regulator of replication initiation timing